MKENSRRRSKYSKRMMTMKWAVKVAIDINPRIFLFWSALSIVISCLPAVSLLFYRNTVSLLSSFYLTGDNNMNACISNIIVLGIVLILSSLSNRLNADFMYMVMYDYYHLGMQEFIMETIQKVEIMTLLSKDYIDEYKALLNRSGSLTDFMSSTCLLVSKVVGTISLLMVSFQVSKIIFIIATLYILATILISLKLSDKARLDMLKVKEAERRIDYIQKLVSIPGVAKEIRIFDSKKDILEQWENEYTKLDDVHYKLAFWKSMISFLCGLGFYLFISVVILYSIFQLHQNRMTIDIFLMLFALGQSLSNNFTVIASAIQNADRGLFSLERQRDFIENVPKKNQTSPNQIEVHPQEDTVIRANNICYSYDNKVDVLHNLRFDIKKGETIALVGSNGSGKSTLVKLLIRLYSPTSGQLYFNGKPYECNKDNEISQSMGMFFQNFCIYHASVRENVAFGNIDRLLDDDRILLSMDHGGARILLNKMEKGLDHWLQKDVLNDGLVLSGGEKQKIGISRTFMSDKDIFIFDEPASALDPIAEMKQFKTIKEQIAGKTTILISHRVGFARLADRIFVLDNGCLAEVGTHEELMRKEGIYCNFYNQQAEWYDDVSES